MNFRTLALAGTFAAMSSLPSAAAVITLDFEGVGNLNPVGSFYASQGVEFSPATLAIVDSDAGGSGNFANEPTPDTVMFFLDATQAILNFAAGFEDGFSFFYTSSTSAFVSVWDGLNGSGNQLGQIEIFGGGNSGTAGDPNGSFDTWSVGALAFAGTAKSINFGGTANRTAYDNITFGSTNPTPTIPVPAAAPLLLLGLGALGALARRRRRA